MEDRVLLVGLYERNAAYLLALLAPLASNDVEAADLYELIHALTQ